MVIDFEISDLESYVLKELVLSILINRIENMGIPSSPTEAQQNLVSFLVSNGINEEKAIEMVEKLYSEAEKIVADIWRYIEMKIVKRTRVSK